MARRVSSFLVFCHNIATDSYRYNCTRKNIYIQFFGKKIVKFFTFCKKISTMSNRWLSYQHHWVSHNCIPYDKHNHAYWPKKLLVNAYFLCFLRFAHNLFGVVIIVAIRSLTWPWVCLTVRSSLFLELLYTLVLMCSFFWWRHATLRSRLVIKRHFTSGPPFFGLFFRLPFKIQAVEIPDPYQ